MGVAGRPLAWTRQRVAYLANELIPGVSLNQIGRQLGGRDHTTILHAIRAVAKRRDLGPEEDAALEAILAQATAHQRRAA